MIVMMVGVSEGLLQESLRRTKGVGADILIRPKIEGAAISGADLSGRLPSVLMENIEGISQALGATVFTAGDLQTTTGVDWDGLDRMSGGIVIFEGRPYEAPYEALVDEMYSRQMDASVGDTIELMGHDFEVVGIVETGKMSRVFIPLETMAELQGWGDRLSQIYLKLEDPARARDVIEQLRVMMPDRSVISVEDFLALTATSVRQMSSQFVNIIISIAVAIGFIVVMLAMYTAILERTREIGILKAIGGSKRFIGTIVLRETIAVTVVGILVGYCLSVVGQRLVALKYPLVPVLLLPDWMAGAAALTIVGSIAGATYPAWKAASADPCDVLSYE